MKLRNFNKNKKFWKTWKVYKKKKFCFIIYFKMYI